jgi:hypothetical protein
MNKVQEKIQELKNTAQAAQSVSEELFTKLRQLKDGQNNPANLNFQTLVKNMGYSVADVELRVTGFLIIVLSTDSSSSELFAPIVILNNIISNINTVQTACKKLINDLNNIQNNGGVGSIEEGNYAIVSANGSVRFELWNELNNIENPLDSAISYYAQCAYFLKAKKTGDFSLAIKSLQKISDEANIKIQSITALENKAAESKQKIEDNATLISSSLQDAEQKKVDIYRICGEIQNHSTTSANNLQQIGANLDRSKELSAEADILKSTIESYQATFNTFQKVLDERTAQINSGKAKQDSLVSEMQEHLAEIRNIEEQSKQMLSGATIAGLAGEYGKIKDDLSKRLQEAQRAFYFSLFLLFVSTLPLLTVMFQIDIPTLGIRINNAHSNPTAWQLLGDILVRMIIIIPAAWLCKFSSARHAALFKLKEDYAYKYSVAASVEGFKKQAEKFSDEIAFATFKELCFNPADKMAKEKLDADCPQPVLQKFLHILENKLTKKDVEGFLTAIMDVTKRKN